MSKGYTINGRNLETKHMKVHFNFNIKEVIFYNNIYVVLLDIPNNVNEIDNIYGVNSQGNIIWRIENAKKAFPTKKIGTAEYDNMTSSIYVGLQLSSNGEFIASTFFAIKYKFDYKTGKILKKEIGRW